MNLNHESVWANCLSFIEDNVSAQAFKTWFIPIKAVKLEEAVLTIQVPSQFFYEWLEEHYVDLLRKSIGKELGKEARRRLETMCRTQDGFEIAEVDLELRGPGDLMGTKQSGVLDLKVADLVKDRALLEDARDLARRVLGEDPDLDAPKHALLRTGVERLRASRPDWSRIA